MNAATSLDIILIALAGLVASGAVAHALSRRLRLSLLVGAAGALASCILGATASVAALLDGGREAIALDGILPLGRLAVGIDPLSAFFLLAVFVVSGLAALYAIGYFSPHGAHADRPAPFFFFNLLIASMAGVVIARDGVLFIVLWEIMSIASYFLVVHDHERPEVRHAGFIYLVASHIGVVFLLALFATLASPTGDFGFDALRTAATGNASLATTAFILATIGFGMKSGFWPAHVWLPEAHPAAPSPISAVMSGVMIKLGIYGLLRVITFVEAPPASWGFTLLAVGIITGVMGVLLALAQHDLKRLLAYHSVENIGIIAIGIGVGLLGQAEKNTAVAFLGYAGALLHVLNHGLFKGLLFHCAGSVLVATGTRDMNKLGGLARRMPLTAFSFLVGAVAICGLPPLNGFVSEWLIYVGAFRGAVGEASGTGAWVIAAVPALALIGGLATACFVKVLGIVFLGEARSEAVRGANEGRRSMRTAMLAGVAFCAVIGVAPMLALALVERPASALAAINSGAVGVVPGLVSITTVAGVTLGGILLLALCRRILIRRRDVRSAPTWGCGYEAPTPRMQYTAPSFARPLLTPFTPLVPAHRKAQGPVGYFPREATFDEPFRDVASDALTSRAVSRFVRVARWFKRLQRGRIQVYVVYVFAVLVALLIWQLAALRGAA